MSLFETQLAGQRKTDCNFSFFFNFFIYLLSVYEYFVHMHICPPCVPVGSPRIGVMDGCDSYGWFLQWPLCGCQELNPVLCKRNKCFESLGHLSSPRDFSFIQGLKDGRHEINRTRKTKQKCIVCRNNPFAKVVSYSVSFLVVHFIEQFL